MSLPADFTPIRQEISAITNAVNAVVTTTQAHGYTDGSWVRLIVPGAYGMEIDYVQTQITVLASNQFQTTLNSLNLEPFVTPTAPPAFTQAQVVPISQLTTVVDP